MNTVHACQDCVDIHGDTASDWLAQWPAGAEYRTDHHAYLCDGCADDRNDHADADECSDEYDAYYA